MYERQFWREIHLRLLTNWPDELNDLGSFDWIEPKRYTFGSGRPHIKGNLGFIGGRSIPFVLYLPGEPNNLGEVDWASASKERSSDWIRYEPDTRTIELRMD
ncbi:MAG: hypothetical protein AAAFM81_15095 [Pseudomonadota bacterium]